MIDSHAHLDMLDDLADALARARDAGVGRVVTIGVDERSNEWAVAAARERPELRATVGLHPHDAKSRTDELMARLAELASDDGVVGVGEAGLDYHYDLSPRDRQRDVFAEHVRLARALDKPLVVHTREAWDDTFMVLEDEGPVPRIVFHCFTGGVPEAARALAMGAWLSFSGIVTFPKADEIREAARACPLGRIVVETDAPYLAPEPHRGKRNEPAYVVRTAEAIAGLRGMPFDELAGATAANTARLFGL